MKAVIYMPAATSAQTWKAAMSGLYSGGDAQGLHTANFIVKTRPPFVVYYASVEKYTVENAEVIFQMAKMIHLYKRKFCFKSSAISDCCSTRYLSLP